KLSARSPRARSRRDEARRDDRDERARHWVTVAGWRETLATSRGRATESPWQPLAETCARGAWCSREARYRAASARFPSRRDRGVGARARYGRFGDGRRPDHSRCGADRAAVEGANGTRRLHALAPLRALSDRRHVLSDRRGREDSPPRVGRDG